MTLTARVTHCQLAESKAYLKLWKRIERHVPVERSNTTIAGQPYPWLKVIDPDQLLENALTRSDRSAEELDPFWAATWRAAIGLDRYLAQCDIRGQRLLELGCGSGRAGIAAALRGAKVTMTDAASEGLLVARFNAWSVRQNVHVRRLHWGNQKLDDDPFPWIIGSDIVYDPSLWTILEPCIKKHLACKGRVLLSEPQRHTGDRFLPWIQSRDWTVQLSMLDLGDGERDIRIFELSRT